ncbi:hypothetical protein T552_01193 [Pneumocystis carinii B80]|uniref:Mitotic checkpoint regulator, MAD2B-interacting-domain-containing protein n=1 Tax=Pneumocystis carinii (strain B80) TaxID=1408658 RepID=A0A0W4ZLP8_PNEC8|nr:hypothetical protein T552_01193 [Pneumocystis carinii B80]KTW29238.1 hypothetical protein T552_01193 [Pneumocystis carinii B80]
MASLVNYSDSDDTEEYSEENTHKSLKRKELDDVSDSSFFPVLTKENILKLPKIDKEYELEDTRESSSLNKNAVEGHVSLSSLLPAPKNDLKMARLSRNNGTRKLNIKIENKHDSTIKNTNSKNENMKNDYVQSNVSLFSLDIEKSNINEYEQTMSNSSSYTPMLVRKQDHLNKKRNVNIENVKLSEKKQQNVHCSEIYRVDKDIDVSEYNYPLIEEETQISRKEKDVESMRIYGKRRSEQGPVKFLEVNAEEEYNANEIMKRKGILVEAPQPIRAIGAGRHQITTLLNSAISQREVFEEAFAANKETKRQSGKKYGF